MSLEKIRELCDAASEWSTFENKECGYLGDTLICLSDTYEDCEHDTKFIAAFRTVIPALLEVIAVQSDALKDIKQRGCPQYLCNPDTKTGVPGNEAAVASDAQTKTEEILNGLEL